MLIDSFNFHHSSIPVHFRYLLPSDVGLMLFALGSSKYAVFRSVFDMSVNSGGLLFYLEFKNTIPNVRLHSVIGLV